MAMVMEELYACVPAAERGRGILVGADPASRRVAYCNGRSVVLRSLAAPLLRSSVYAAHSAAVTVARFSPGGGHWIASADASGCVRVWAAGDGYGGGSGAAHPLKCEFRPLSSSIHDLQWSSDGQRIVVCGHGKGGKSFVRAVMWDSGNSIGDFDGNSKPVLSCDFKPTRPFRIATGGEDFLVNFYEGPPFKFKSSHREHGNYVNCVRFSPDGSKFLSAGSDKKMVICDGKLGSVLSVCSPDTGHTGSIYAVSWNQSSSQVLTVSADNTARIWNIAAADGSATLHATYTFASQDMQVGCLWLNEFIVTFSLSGKINFLSPDDTAAPIAVVSGHMKSITSVATLGSEVYSSSYDGVVIRWKLGVGFDQRMDIQSLGSLDGLLAAADGKLFVWGQNKAIMTSMSSGEDGKMVDFDEHCLGFAIASGDGDAALALACTEHGLTLLRNLVVVAKLLLPYACTTAALSPDGKTAIVGNANGCIHVYSLAGDAFVEEAVLERHRGSVTALKFSPDGSLFASGDQNREALVWDAVSREVKLKNMLYHTARIKCIAWSPDSARVATGSLDGCVYVYHVDEPASSKVTIKGAHTGAVSGLAFADCQRLVTGGDDACVRVWALP